MIARSPDVPTGTAPGTANGLPISRAANGDRDHARAESGFQKRSDLGAAQRRLLHGRVSLRLGSECYLSDTVMANRSILDISHNDDNENRKKIYTSYLVLACHLRWQYPKFLVVA